MTRTLHILDMTSLIDLGKNCNVLVGKPHRPKKGCDHTTKQPCQAEPVKRRASFLQNLLHLLTHMCLCDWQHGIMHELLWLYSMVVNVDAVCLQTSRHERDEAEQKLSKVTAENADLVQRFHDMKSTEVERMNEVNRACEEMVSFGLMHASS